MEDMDGTYRYELFHCDCLVHLLTKFAQFILSNVGASLSYVRAIVHTLDMLGACIAPVASSRCVTRQAGTPPHDYSIFVK